MKIAIGCDHGGYELKEKLVVFLKENNHEVVDFGTYSLESIDYPDYAVKVANGVSNKEFDRGVVVCSTGIGVSIVANKVKNIRCALVHDLKTAKLTREHNDSNVIAFGAKIIDESLAKEILSVWLNTEFEGGRHIRRINKISMIEGSYKVNVINNPLLNQLVNNLNNSNQNEFNEIIYKIGCLMSYEISKSFLDNSEDIIIISNNKNEYKLANGLYDMINYINKDHTKLLDYKDITDLENKTVILTDNMLVNNENLIKDISILKEKGAKNIIYVGIVGSNKAVDELINTYDDIKIYLASCDEI